MIAMWWLMWEDDWAVQRGASDLLTRARDVASSAGYHQVAMNGAWLADDSAWGERGAPPLAVKHTPSGTSYVLPVPVELSSA